jgi:hypothetical protein
MYRTELKEATKRAAIHLKMAESLQPGPEQSNKAGGLFSSLTGGWNSPRIALMSCNAVHFRRNAVDVTTYYRLRDPCPEELRDSLSAHSVSSTNLAGRPPAYEIEEHDAPLNVRAMQMRENRHL